MVHKAPKGQPVPRAPLDRKDRRACLVLLVTQARLVRKVHKELQGR